MTSETRTYLFIGSLFVSLVAGLLCSNVVRKKWGHVPWFRLRVLGISLICLVPFYAIPSLFLLTLFVHGFVFWLNFGLFIDMGNKRNG